MFYYWLAPLGKQFILFNLFNYIAFRAAGAGVTALVLCFVVGPAVIRRLRAHKIGQIIRAEGPASHQGQRGTPTMGGIVIIFATLWNRRLVGPSSLISYLYVLCAQVILSAIYLFLTYWTAMRNLMYANR